MLREAGCMCIFVDTSYAFHSVLVVRPYIQIIRLLSGFGLFTPIRQMLIATKRQIGIEAMQCSGLRFM